MQHAPPKAKRGFERGRPAVLRRSVASGRASPSRPVPSQARWIIGIIPRRSEAGHPSTCKKTGTGITATASCCITLLHLAVTLAQGQPRACRSLRRDATRGPPNDWRASQRRPLYSGQHKGSAMAASARKNCACIRRASCQSQGLGGESPPYSRFITQILPDGWSWPLPPMINRLPGAHLTVRVAPVKRKRTAAAKMAKCRCNQPCRSSSPCAGYQEILGSCA